MTTTPRPEHDPNVVVDRSNSEDVTLQELTAEKYTVTPGQLPPEFTPKAHENPDDNRHTFGLGALRIGYGIPDDTQGEAVRKIVGELWDGSRSMSVPVAVELRLSLAQILMGTMVDQDKTSLETTAIGQLVREIEKPQGPDSYVTHFLPLVATALGSLTMQRESIDY